MGNGRELVDTRSGNQCCRRTCSEVFRLSESRATEILQNIKQPVSNWNKVEAKYNISRSEQKLVAPAFHVAES